MARIIRSIVLIFSTLLGTGLSSGLSGQAVPGKDENISFLVTFGKEARTSYGDQDFHQIFFFTIPRDFKQQFYIRIFDPDCGGEYDEIQGDFNTKNLFSVYGGRGVDPEKNEESKGLVEGLNYKTGNLLVPRLLEMTAGMIISTIL